MSYFLTIGSGGLVTECLKFPSAHGLVKFLAKEFELPINPKYSEIIAAPTESIIEAVAKANTSTNRVVLWHKSAIEPESMSGSLLDNYEAELQYCLITKAAGVITANCPTGVKPIDEAILYWQSGIDALRNDADEAQWAY